MASTEHHDKVQAEDGAPGQFDDAPADNVTDALSALNLAPSYNPREGEAFIDEDAALEWSSSDDDDEYDDDSGNEAAVWEDSVARVDDEDWEIADRGGYDLERPSHITPHANESICRW